ncbi:ammonium transporter [Desulfacinum hydrothermale DSM 13146]|uniref:Ammonium transporter n=1 Tax=Desulfacinum hydrothermale DSM 13146 TaxID=1121390 RepID=A0A1W1XEY6_9BACT|nr:ammonium transporter [Desulfacinum hydrothermale]SMC22476.1 ammonium transporter [Desulfacinum hydrothermale DSM 13146]
MFYKTLRIAVWFVTLMLPATALADGPTAADVQTHLDYVWTLMAAALVFFMQAGFALVETGFTRAKNAVNIMMKNLMDFSIGTLGFWAVGFGLMFGASLGGWVGTSGFFLSDYAPGGNPWVLAFWMFQVVFCATAATIVSGALAERTKFVSYLCFSFVISAIIYPVFGSWVWGSLFHGNGWLEKLGFIDFAGSTVVHSVGGWAALAGTLVLGPRIGKYDAQGRPRAIPGHNLPLAALGVFILWIGWFGFNPGSTTAGVKDIAWIFVNTNLSAAAGTMGALITIWTIAKKPDLTMTLNGALAGLVGITAGCNNVSPAGAVMIGFLAGILVVVSVLFFDRIRIDDPVGAISVHGVCGVWGTLAAAIFHTGGFSMGQLGVQALGAAAAFLWAFPTAYLTFRVLHATVGLRVSPEEEMNGLDLEEHGESAYPDFALMAGGTSAVVPNNPAGTKAHAPARKPIHAGS